MVGLITARMEEAGWRVAPTPAAGSTETFAGLIPAPDAVLTLQAATTSVQSLAALHFSESGGEISYACTLHLPNGEIAVERGRIDAATLAVTVAESRGSFAAHRVLKDAPAPPPVPAKEAGGREDVRTARAAPPATPSAPPPPASEPLHPSLAAILQGTAATGWHTCRWADLRRSVFPGPDGWNELKAWCARHSLDCALCFGASSKKTEVQFSRARPAPTA